MTTDQTILTFTDKAKKHIKASVEKAGGGHFRLWIKVTGCSGYMYMPEIVSMSQEHDLLVGQIDEVNIYLANDAVDIVRGTQVDFVTKSMGFSQLEFANPNATGLCGCGESFKLIGDKHA